MDTPEEVARKLRAQGVSSTVAERARQKMHKQRARDAKRQRAQQPDLFEEVPARSETVRWDEERASAEDWYAEYRRSQDLSGAMIAANQRRDHLLPEDER